MNQELDAVVLNEMERMYRFAYGQLQDAYRAEDATQTAILRAYMAYPRLREKEKTVPWLWGILRNTVMQGHRANAELSVDEITLIDLCGVSYETPQSEYLRRCDIMHVRRAVASLAENYRNVCVLYYFEDKSYEEIANQLGIPLSSVKWRLNQSRSQLKEEILKMEFMEHGYRAAKKLKVNIGGYVDKNTTDSPRFAPERALETLLAQNICLDAYDRPKTVTELSSDLGVSADYIEDVLRSLVKAQCIKETANRYRTTFPIWDGAAMEEIYNRSLEYARQFASEVLDSLLALEDAVKQVGFYGSEWKIERLMIMLIGFVCQHTQKNEFETERLPFTEPDRAWYILATTEDHWGDNCYSYGINSCGSRFGLREYYFVQEFLKDDRFFETKEQKAFYSVYCGEEVSDEYLLSRLLESGKVKKAADGGYAITVPVINGKNGEREALRQVLDPVIARTNAIQRHLYDDVGERLKKYIPPHLMEQLPFLTVIAFIVCWRMFCFRNSNLAIFPLPRGWLHGLLWEIVDDIMKEGLSQMTQPFKMMVELLQVSAFYFSHSYNSLFSMT